MEREPTRHKNFPLHLALSLPRADCVSPLSASAKNSFKLGTQLPALSLSLSVLISLVYALFLCCSSNTSTQLNFLFAVFQFHNIPKRPCAQLTLSACCSAALSKQQHPLSAVASLPWNAIELHLLLMLLLLWCVDSVYSFLFYSFLVIVLLQLELLQLRCIFCLIYRMLHLSLSQLRELVTIVIYVALS